MSPSIARALRVLANTRARWFASNPGKLLPAMLANPVGHRLRKHYNANGVPVFAVDRDATQREMAQAVRLHKGFTGRAPLSARKIKLPKQPRAGVVLGHLIQVGYESTRDGQPYRHTFRKSSRPLLVASSDGTQALIVGGRFAITERGIEDQ